MPFTASKAQNTSELLSSDDSRQDYAPMLSLSTRQEDGRVRCDVCPHACVLKEGQTGLCRVRVGDRVVPVMGQGFMAQGVGTIEDHPLFHFHPGSRVFCVGSTGCTAFCRYCQNWELALAPRLMPQWQGRKLSTSVEEVIDKALESRCETLALTYNEATVWIEAMLQLASRAKMRGLKVVLVTNGYLTTEAFRLLMPILDAVKLDLKAPDESRYRTLAGISLRPVLETLEQLAGAGVWHEVSTVVAPGVCDSKDDVSLFVEHLLRYSGKDTPWHLLRFFPAFQLVKSAPGKLDQLVAIRRQALEMGLRYVYVSNIPGLHARDTRCPDFGQLLASRGPSRVGPLPQHCAACGAVVAGRGLQ